jgi:hypothetical protein
VTGNRPICRKEGATAVLVADLLTDDGQMWDEDALNQNLLPLDAEEARRVPLGRAQGVFFL